MDELDYQNINIRARAKKEFVKGLIWFLIGMIITIGTYLSASAGSYYIVTYGLLGWSLYKMFLASKFYILGRNAVSFPKTKTGPTSSVLKGKIYKHKD